MIVLFNANETNFNNNGICTLDNVLFSLPKIIEELNGQFTMELEVSISDNSKFQLIDEEMIIKADDNYFRIKEIRKNLDSIYIFAKQVFWDFEDNLLEDVRPTNLNGSGTLDYIKSNTQYPHSFTFSSDISTIDTAYYIRKDPVAAIMSEDNCFLKIWGGEIQLDKFNCSINQRRGLDRGVSISYGKNLIGLEQDLNMNSVKTRIMPLGRDENNNVVMLPEKYIDSQYINSYNAPKILIQDYPNIKVDPNNNIILDDVYSELRAEVQKLYNSGIDLPYFNYTVNFQDLSTTEEYKNYAVLERVYLGDTVTIKHLKLKINLSARVIKTTKIYNITTQKWEYSEIQLGQFKATYTDQKNQEFRKFQSTLEIVKSDYQNAIDNATQLIMGSKGGNVVINRDANGHPYEILIMDTTDINTALNVWRWNSGGFGYSSKGYNGPYGTAITMDGHIVASFITALEITGEMIKAGIIQSKTGKWQLNLDSETFNLGDKLTFDGESGNLTLAGILKTLQTDGSTAIELIGTNLNFYDSGDRAGNRMGAISSSHIVPSNSPTIVFDVYRGCSLGLGYQNLEIDPTGDTFTNLIELNNGADTGGINSGDIGRVDIFKTHLWSTEHAWRTKFDVSIAAGTSMNLVHNLGYVPLITTFGSTGNLILTFDIIDNNTIKVNNYNTGNNTFTGSIYFR